MTHRILTRLVLGVALLAAPAILVGCGEPPAPTTSESTPAPNAAPPSAAPSGGAAAAPSGGAVPASGVGASPSADKPAEAPAPTK